MEWNGREGFVAYRMDSRLRQFARSGCNCVGTLACIGRGKSLNQPAAQQVPNGLGFWLVPARGVRRVTFPFVAGAGAVHADEQLRAASFQ
jgi:hypothetical protein